MVRMIGGYMAGESAGAEAHAEQVRAELLPPTDAPEREASVRDVQAEMTTDRILGALSGQGWRVFHDARWPGREHANIDHVLVGPSGIFVIDTLDWIGSVEVRSGALRKDGKRRSRNVIASAAAAIAVGEVLPGLSPKTIHPVICLTRDEPVFGWCGDVMVCSTENIVTFLTSRPRVLDETQMTDIAQALSVSLQSAAARMPPPVVSYAGDTPINGPRRPDARPKKLPRAPIPEPVRIVALIGAVAVAAALAFQFNVPARLGDLGADAAHRVVVPTKPIGTTVAVPGLVSRPSLKITAGTPVVTRSKLRGVTVTPGNQLVAVPVSVRNTGDKAWRSHDDVKAEMTDTTGATYSNDPAYTSVSDGKSLPGTLTLSPQKETRGFVVFEVPRGAQLAKFHLRVGPGLPATLRWSVH
jgi:hypothetical protein